MNTLTKEFVTTVLDKVRENLKFEVKHIIAAMLIQVVMHMVAYMDDFHQTQTLHIRSKCPKRGFETLYTHTITFWQALCCDNRADMWNNWSIAY